MGNPVQKIQRNQKRPLEEEESKEDETSTFTCEICIEPMLSSSTKKFKNNNKCVHPFCTDCMIKYIHQLKVEESVANVPFPALNYEQLLDHLCCRSMIPAKLFHKWCDVLCESAILGLERCYYPNRNCSALVVNECGGNVKRSECPNCKRMFCFHWFGGPKLTWLRQKASSIEAQLAFHHL
ncbi:uncharacterized protein LOC132316284 [Cornus florida]|uniref:uncharacterized protein LOC132316284 n=1 Tax=Cornus florida TaxID=4283 RepID=UPI0028A260CF|nr:uncharacterized protein LOC132316284 [Cornus florida]